LGVLALALLSGLPSADRAEAGAWPRDDGASFLSVSLESPVDTTAAGLFASLYYEYGLTSKLTFGIDAGRDVNTRSTSALVFLRYPVFSGGAHTVAVELGLGETVQNGRSSATIRPGLSWGRGLQIGDLNGWTGIEATYAHRADDSSLGKIDATLGANLAEGRLAMVQLQYEAPSNGQSLLAVAPSYVFGLTRTTRLQVGLRHELRTGTTSAKIGLWLDF
jgi:hypothetical protein